MMISPESYYEMELKGKTTAQIMSVIHDLQNTIEQLKNVMENPDYRNQPKIHPSESVQVSCMRLYLEKAKNALAETGGIYIPSEAELTAADFEENISAISKLVFSVSDAVTGAAYECDIEHMYLMRNMYTHIMAGYMILFQSPQGSVQWQSMSAAKNSFLRNSENCTSENGAENTI